MGCELGNATINNIDLLRVFSALCTPFFTVTGNDDNFNYNYEFWVKMSVEKQKNKLVLLSFCDFVFRPEVESETKVENFSHTFFFFACVVNSVSGSILPIFEVLIRNSGGASRALGMIIPFWLAQLVLYGFYVRS